MAAANERFTAWLVGLAGVRDALGRLPSVPPLFWFSGAIVLVMMLAVRFAKFRKLMSDALPAPREVNALVRLVADHIGLRVAPRAYMVDARISPMIYCGRATRLLIPVDLWNQLDRDGRLAILSHELAHVRRRDHWVCWMETFIGCLFWWHPVLWWVRRRLHEEAEYCCDAWVTWLMPHGRRAYAEALLHAKTYLAGHRGCAPAVGVGMTTTRTQRFARRLKMVMTDRSKPGLSLAGLTLVVALASAGWAATPCPDKKVKAARTDTPAPTVVVQPFAQPSIQTRVATPALAPTVSVTPSPLAQPVVTWRGTAPAVVSQTTPSVTVVTPSPPVAAVTASPLGTRTSVLAPPAGLTATWGDEKDVEKRLSKLEKQLEKLSKQLDKIAGDTETPSAPRAGARNMPGVPSAPAVQAVPRAPALRAWQGGAAGGGPSADGGAVEIRTYELPDGKLDALVQLMIRSDVPVPVGRRDGAIEVHATPAQHKVFKAFVELIHPEGAERSGADEEGSRFGAAGSFKQWRDALADEERAAQASPDPAAAMRLYAGAAKQGQEAREEAMEAAREWQEKAREEQVTAIREAQRLQQNALRQAQREQHRAQRTAQVEQRRAQARQRQDHADALGHEMEALERHAEELRERAESLSAKIEEIQDGDNPDKDAIRELREEMKGLEREARNIERRARDLERQADRLREESDRLSEEADGIQEEADQDEDQDEDEDGGAESAAAKCAEQATTEYAVLARALSGAAQAIEDEAAPKAAEAIAEATELLRAGAAENAHGALLEAAAAMSEGGETAAEAAPLIRELLTESVTTMKGDAPSVVARLLERANVAMQNGGAAEARRTLTEALKALNAEAKARAESKEGGK